MPAIGMVSRKFPGFWGADDEEAPKKKREVSERVRDAVLRILAARVDENR